MPFYFDLFAQILKLWNWKKSEIKICLIFFSFVFNIEIPSYLSVFYSYKRKMNWNSELNKYKNLLSNIITACKKVLSKVD